MFRLVKLALLGFFFYMLHEFAVGLLAKRAQAASASLPQPPVRQHDMNITGATGEGTIVPVIGPGGSRRRTKVGRGVI